MKPFSQYERRRHAVLGVFGEQFLDEFLDFGRRLRRPETQRRRRVVTQRVNDLWHGTATEGRDAGQQRVQHAADRVEIAPLCHRFAFGLFGRHVVDRADHATVRCHLAGAEQLRDAEVGQLHEPFARDQQVGRLDVAVDDPAVVRQFQTDGDLQTDPQRFGHGEDPARFQFVLQTAAIHQLHRIKQPTFLFAIRV